MRTLRRCVFPLSTIAARIRVLAFGGALVLQPWSIFAPLIDLESRCSAAESSDNQLEDVLWWLPADTETAIISRKPYQLKERADVEASQWSSKERRFSFDIRREYAKPLDGQTVQLDVMAMHRFRGPKGLGGSHFDGCTILVFANDLGAVGDNLMQCLLRDSPEALEFDGVKVAKLTRQIEQDEWTFFVARPRPDVLIQATDRASLEEVLSRMRSRHPKRALPAELPEWRHLDPEADAWAIRHFDRDEWTDDPNDARATDITSPFFHQRRIGFDPSAIGLCFSAPREGEKEAKVLYLSGSEHALEATQPTWREYAADLAPGVEATVEEIKPGIIQITHPIDTDRAAAKFGFLLMMHLGIVMIV